MIKILADWIHAHAVGLFTIALILSCLYTIISLVEVTRKPAPLDKVEGVQHHLVWDINGKCFFVKPHSEFTNYLVAVPDCDKK